MFNPENYTIIAHLFPRLLGLIYLFALFPFYFQIIGLIGSNGILPVGKYLNALRTLYPKKCYLYAPTLLWINSSDRALMSLVIVGIALSIGLISGFYPSLLLVLLYIIYISIVSVGQDFLSFGWEGFLLEITMYTFLITLTPIPTLFSWICINLLLFRFMLCSGTSKLYSRDINWRNLTAIAFHYQSQPLPNTLAWYVHKWPLWFHQTSTYLMFIIEIIFPFGIFGSDMMRLVVFFSFVGLQWTIWVTGNFSYLNHMTIVLGTILLSNDVLQSIFTLPTMGESAPIFESVINGIAICLIGLQLLRLWVQFEYNQFIYRWLSYFYLFHLANPYGIFAVMTTRRIEIVVVGSQDGEHWEEYAFKYKPSEIDRRPRRISPYQPRIDWQAWFLPFSDFESEPWFQSFLYHLLKGTKEVLGLLRANPFPDNPPKYICAWMYEYEFSSVAEKKEKGWWWRRSYLGQYSPILKLRDE